MIFHHMVQLEKNEIKNKYSTVPISIKVIQNLLNIKKFKADSLFKNKQYY